MTNLDNLSEAPRERCKQLAGMTVLTATGPGLPPQGKGVVLKNEGSMLVVAAPVGPGRLKVAGKDYVSPDGSSFYETFAHIWSSPPYAVKLDGKAYQLTELSLEVEGRLCLRLVESSASLPEPPRLKPGLKPPPALMSTVQWPPAGQPGSKSYLVTTDGLKEIRDLPLADFGPEGPVLTTEYQGEELIVTRLTDLGAGLALSLQSARAQNLTDLLRPASRATYSPGKGRPFTVSKNAAGEITAAYRLEASQVLALDAPRVSGQELMSWLTADTVSRGS